MRRTAPPGRTEKQAKANADGAEERAVRERIALAVFITLLIGSLIMVLAGPADAGPAPGVDVELGPFAGTIALDRHLGDFRWDTRARAVWGAAGRADLGPFGAGARVWRTSTTQSLGIPGEDLAPAVHLTGTELVGETRLARVGGARLLASGSAGLVRIAWDPDAAVIDDGAGGTIDVAFAPVTEWTAGLGLGVRRTLVGGLDASVGVERTWFRLDTTHRAGSEIVRDRETFGNWTARVEITHRILQI